MLGVPLSKEAEIFMCFITSAGIAAADMVRLLAWHVVNAHGTIMAVIIYIGNDH